MKRPIAAILFLAAVFYVGCESTKTPNTSHQKIVDCQPGVRGGSLTIPITGNIPSFNPGDPRITDSSFELIQHLFGTLIREDQLTHRYYGELAESWEMLEDEKTWIFHLRPAVKWSDGVFFKADDVVFTLNEYYQNSSAFDPFVKQTLQANHRQMQVKKIDDYTIQITFDRPYSLALAGLSIWSILPKHKLESNAHENRSEAYGLSSTPAEIVTTGPFRLKDFSPGYYTTLERNPFYYAVDKKGTQLPYLDEVTFLEVEDNDTKLQSVLTGKTDILNGIAATSLESFRKEMDTHRLKLIDIGLEIDQEVLVFNQMFIIDAETKKPYPPFVDLYKLKWFTNPKFRKAISHAIDREKIVKRIYPGIADAATGFVSKGDAQWASTKIPSFMYNPDAAQKLFNEIGMTNKNQVLKDPEGHAVEFTLTHGAGNHLRALTCELIKEDLAKVGIAVKLEEIPFEEVQDQLRYNNGFECIIFVLGRHDVVPHWDLLKISSSMHVFRTSIATDWEKKLDQLADIQMATLKPEIQKKQSDEIQEIMAENLPVISTITRHIFGTAHGELRNLKPSNVGNRHLTWNLEELYWKNPKKHSPKGSKPPSDTIVSR